jgi:non-homologous end joining protein Ku
MLDLAQHIVVSQNTSTFEPEKFEDHYEAELTQLINQKRSGKPIEGAAKVLKRSRPDGCPETQHRKRPRG